MATPLIPLLALGGFGLWAHLAMRPKHGAQANAPEPYPSELLDPWAASPPLPPPASVPAPGQWPAPSPIPAPAPAPSVAPPSGRTEPVVALPTPASPVRDTNVLRDVNDVLTSPEPPPPNPAVVVAPTPAPVPVSNPSQSPLPPVVMPPPAPEPPPPSFVMPPPARQPVAPSNVIPEPTTTHAELPPPGFNPVAAKAQAARVAANLRKGRDQYSRPTLSTWQRLAGIDADGIYGGQSAGALAWYLQGESVVAPRPFFKPTTPTPYRWIEPAARALTSHGTAS